LKRFHVERAPPVLLFHLNRFHKFHGARLRKHDDFVSFPFHLYLHPKVSQGGQEEYAGGDLGCDAAPPEAPPSAA
jgi:hypothetical protein